MRVMNYGCFTILLEGDGWYAETTGGTCLGPFNSFTIVLDTADDYMDLMERLQLHREPL